MYLLSGESEEVLSEHDFRLGCSTLWDLVKFYVSIKQQDRDNND